LKLLNQKDLTDLIVIILLTLLNGFFSLSEIALVSVKKSKMQHLANSGNKRARKVIEILENPEHFLSSVQVGITLIGIISGAYGGAALSDDMNGFLSQFIFLGNYTQVLSLLIVIGGITYFSIVVGELVPKTLAMNNADNIALICVPIINYFTYATYPFVKLLSVSTKLILKIIGAKENDSEHMSEEELKFMLKNAGKSGVMEDEESEVHQNIFSFSDQTARTLMTHSSQVEWINIHMDKQVILEKLIEYVHSKIIVSDGLIDNVIGILHARDFMENYSKPDFNVKDYIEEPFFIAQNMPSFSILTKFKQNKQYNGCVIDEYGSFMGVITLHDLIEGIVGDLPEEEEDRHEIIVKRSDETFLIDGRATIFEINNFFGEEILEPNPHYSTVAGYVIDQMKTMPEVGDQFENDFFFIEVIDLDGRRIDKILLSLK
jgi:putative hemolysin